MERESANFRSTFPPRDSSGFRSAIWKYGVPGPGDEIKLTHATLLDALDAAARDTEAELISLAPDDESAPEHRFPFSTWQSDAKRAAVALRAVGLAKGERVLLVLPTSYDFLVMFFAVQYAGGIAVPTYPPAMLEKAELALERLSRVAKDAGASLCVTDSKLFPLLGGLGSHVKELREILVAERLRKPQEKVDFGALDAVRPGPKDVAFLQYTSGSTGYPKGVALTNRNVCTNIHVIGQALRINRHDCGVSWLPLYHDMGLIGAMLFPVYFQFAYTLMSPMAFLMRPARWLWALHNTRSTLTVAPNFAYALCVKRTGEKEREGLDLSTLRVAMNGAEQVNYRQVVDFQRMFAPHGFKDGVMLPVYGLAESSLAVTFPTPGDPVRYEVVDRSALAQGDVVKSKGHGSTAVVCLGKQLPGHEVVVVDAEGGPVAEGRVGHVVVRGPSIMSGYWQNPDETVKVVRDGWLWTGDLGYQTADGLYVTGRAKDMIILRGHNYYAEDIERIIERIPGLRGGGVVAFAVHDDESGKDLAIAVCETRATGDEEKKVIADAVLREVMERANLSLDEVVVVPPGTIPKTSSGKRQRSLTRQRYLAGELLQKKTTKARLALVFARSGAGYFTLLKRKLLNRREPD